MAEEIETAGAPSKAARFTPREQAQQAAYSADMGRKRGSKEAPAATLGKPRDACVNCRFWVRAERDGRETAAWFPEEYQARTHAEIMTLAGFAATWGSY